MNTKANSTPKGFWRENVEALTFAVIMALVIKQFAFEAYKVPTQSMEPTIIGREFGGSRLIANKFTYMLRDPARWEVMIFHYPHNRMLNYVKRGVGVGPEWMFIRGGDLFLADYDLDRDAAFASAKVLRKPRALQDRLFDMNNCIPPGKREVENFRSYWVNENGGSAGGVKPNFDENIVHIDGTKKPVRVRFTRPASEMSAIGTKDRVICNRRFDDWSARAPVVGDFSKFLGMAFPVGKENLEDSVPVGDVRIRIEVKPSASDGKVLFEIRDFSHQDPIIVEIAVEGANEKGSMTLGSVKKDIAGRVPADSWTEISVSNCDDRIEVRIDDEVVLEYDYEHEMFPAARALLSNSQLDPAPITEPLKEKAPRKAFENAVLWGFSGGKADFREIEFSRDNYYTEAGATDFHIPADNFLMLGDNSPDSLDGRGWRVSELQYKDDDGKVVTMYGDAEAVNESPVRPISNPFDSNTRFQDVYGNMHHLDPARIVMVPKKVGDGVEEMLASKTYLGNFVPRKFIQGRAYMTFFPIFQIGPIR
ncbi:MAG: signal peptidase I [Planctomycetota bacterium]|jgi:signal peptidase I